MATFRKVGFNVPRWPIFALTRPGVPIEGVICHEMLGPIADWALGWSDAFWPDAAMGLNAPGAGAVLGTTVERQARLARQSSPSLRMLTLRVSSVCAHLATEFNHRGKRWQYRGSPEHQEMPSATLAPFRSSCRGSTKLGSRIFRPAREI